MASFKYLFISLHYGILTVDLIMLINVNFVIAHISLTSLPQRRLKTIIIITIINNNNNNQTMKKLLN